MKTEIDLVRDYMVHPDGSGPEFSRARSMLDEAIAFEPRAGEGASNAHRERPRPRPRHRRLRWGIGVTLVAAASAAAVLLVVPSAKIPGSPAAAAEITRLAEAVPPVPPLAAGQWYQYQLQGELSANVNSGTTAAPVRANANIPVAIGDWSNSTGAICSSQQFGTVTFDTPADAQAWQTMGLTTTPSNQPATGCAAGLEATYEGGGLPAGPIDVSTITHDPATLEAQLQSGTTGVPAIDNYEARAPGPHAGFFRLTDLLVGPVKGQWPGFGQEILETMALLPGIDALGTMTTHTGANGLGFSMPKQVTLNPSTGAVVSTYTPPTVILDPQDGSLLEARDFDFPVLQGAAQDFVGSPNAMVFKDGVGYGVTAQWIDPVSELKVIDPGSLPGWINTFHIVEAVTAPTASSSAISAVIEPFMGSGSYAYSNGGQSSGQTTYDVIIMGTEARVQAVANTLTTSGLFTSVTVKL